MQRIDSKNIAIDDKGHNVFRDGNPHLSEEVEATHLNAAWFNNVQEELCGLIESQGLELNAADSSQLLQAIERMINPIIEGFNQLIDHIGSENGGALPEKLRALKRG